MPYDSYYPRPESHGRRPRRHRWRRFGYGFALILLAVAYVAWAGYLLPVQALSSTTVTPQPTDPASRTVTLKWPTYGEAALGANGYGILEQHGNTAALPTASVAKIVTAMCVLQKHPLRGNEVGPTITMTRQDVDFFHSYVARDGSVITVRAGQKLSERQALEAMLLRSANNMADTLAVWAFGSISAYSDYANQYVAELGLTDTHIGSVDASGFDPTTVSTASDLVRLGEAALANPVLKSIVGQKTADIPEVGTIQNTNHLLGQDGIIGIKTGNNDQDPGVYLMAANYRVSNGKMVTVVVAVMGAPHLSVAKQDAKALFDSAKAGFQTQTVVPAGQVVGSYQVPWAAPVQVVAQNDIVSLGWQQATPRTSTELKTIEGPAAAGQTVGRISLADHDKSVAAVLKQAVPAPSLWWRLSHPLR